MSFRRRTSETIAGLQRELDTLKAEVAAASPNTGKDAAGAPPASEATAESDFAPPAPGTSLSDVHDQVKTLIEQVDGLDRRQLQDHERLSLRLEELTTQFTNQLLEIGGELDATHQRLISQLAAQDQRFEELSSMASTNGKGSPDALIEELRTNQVRIANDLARHEIAVRQDLATLAELVNRSRAGRAAPSASS
jgi:hypothetical protein